MITITSRNVSEAWALFCSLMLRDTHSTMEVAPRGVRTREFVGPVCTTYLRPEECVLLDPVRDCNPFFHVYEALWMLAGREDVARLQFYSPQIKAYSDDTKTFNGAYGYRWRTYFEYDQLIALIQLLRRDPDTRRAVLTMWDGGADLGSSGHSLDVPCNTQAYFQIRNGSLNMTVCNRSNDAVWGCYGANAVHFSILQQFLAAAVNARVGVYSQVSNSLHVYLEGKAGEVWSRCAAAPPPLLNEGYEQHGHGPLVDTWELFLEEAELLTEPVDGTPNRTRYTEPWMQNVAYPMCFAHALYRSNELDNALRLLEEHPWGAHPWVVAGVQWLRRRWVTRNGGAQR